MDYEKKYKEALEWARKVMQGKVGFVLDEVLEKFPELAESEDEKIRKELLNAFQEAEDSLYMVLTPNRRKSFIAWLEKQGEHQKFRDSIQVGDKVTRNKNGVLVNLSQLDRMAKQDKKGINGNEREIPNSEQKPTGKVEPIEWSGKIKSRKVEGVLKKMLDEKIKSADKVEPKFKVGDNIISTLSNNPYYITEVCNGYYLTDVGCVIMFDAQDNFELIEQKSAENKGMNLVEEEMTPFQKKVFCIVDTAIEEEQGLSNICNELLALAKQDVEYKSAWSEKDEIGLGEALWAIQQARTIAKDENDMGNLWYAEKWLKDLKNRVQPRQGWSEEDERKINRIYSILRQAADEHAFSTSCRLIGDKEGIELQDFLKSLYNRYTWKPSDEQMKFLWKYAEQNNCDGRILTSLYNDLKKLKGM